MGKIYHKPFNSAPSGPTAQDGRRRGEPIGALLSGGLDSAVMLWRLAQRHSRVVPLYVRCGLLWEKAEIASIRRYLKRLAPPHIARLVILDLPTRDVYGHHWSVSGKKVPAYNAPDEECFLPARNLLLITKAAVYLNQQGIHKVALGNLATNPFPDSKKPYLKNLSRILSQSLMSPFRVISPLSKEEKWQLVKSSSHLPLELTLSCARPRHSGGWFHCGRCNKCAERQRAFRVAGVPDRTRYADQRSGDDDF